MAARKTPEKMSSDIIAEIERGRKVGYSDRLIRNSLEAEGYSPDSIKPAFNEADKRRNGNANGNGFAVKTQSVKKQKSNEPEERLASGGSEGRRKHWMLVAAEIIIGILVFAIIGILIYLFLVPAVLG